MLASFKAQMDEIKATVSSLGIDQTAQQIIDTLTSLREQAESLLSKQPLPEPVRPLVEQLIEQVKAIDLDVVVLGPVRNASDQLKVPEEIKAPLTQSLKALQDALDNLIPAKLIDSIKGEIGGALEVLRAFDPAQLAQNLTGFVNQGASFIGELNPESIVQEIRKPFQAVLDLVGTIHPEKLLKPVIDAYDSLLGGVALPSAATALRRSTEALDGASRIVTQGAMQPVAQLGPSGGAVGTSGAAAGNPPSIEGVRPGDVIRMFGYLPNKLRQALSGLGAAPADAALEAFHSFCGGLANGLRSVDSNLSAIETRIRGNIDDLLEPVGQAQLRADLALRANFAAGSASVSLSREAVARVNPGRLRDDISCALEAACDRIRQAVNSTAVSAGEVFEKTAEILARSPLAAVTGELDKFLAALDPEPLAVEFEEFVAAVLKKALSILPAMEGAIKEFIARMRVLVRELNPGTQALNFLSVLEVLREELDVLNPRRLAADLAIVHVAIREAISAYDPGVLATEIGAILKSIADKLKTLNPAALLGDLSFLDAIKAKIDEVAPDEAFAGVGESLKEVGKQLAALDPGSLLASVEGLAAPVEEAFEKVVKHIKHEIIALLESLKFALTSASVSVSASAEVG